MGHKLSARGIEVDLAKIDVIEKLPPPSNAKGIRSFQGHAGFYRRFIKDFSKIARPLSNLLNKDVVFKFDEECSAAFQTLKDKLTIAVNVCIHDFDDAKDKGFSSLIQVKNSENQKITPKSHNSSENNS